eukprot:15366129-Ditylum_brightwellii.AAC.3
MLAMLQRPLSSMAKLSCNYKYLVAAMTGRDLDTTEFVEVKVAVQDMIHGLKSCVENDKTGNIFTRPPSTWFAPAETNKTPTNTNPPADNNHKLNDDKNRASDGMVVEEEEDPGRRPSWPEKKKKWKKGMDQAHRRRNLLPTNNSQGDTLHPTYNPQLHFLLESQQHFLLQACGMG